MDFDKMTTKQLIDMYDLAVKENIDNENINVVSFIMHLLHLRGVFQGNDFKWIRLDKFQTGVFGG